LITGNSQLLKTALHFLRFKITEMTLSRSCKSIPNPSRMTPTIKDCIGSNHRILNPIVDSEWKSLGEKPVIAEVQRVNPGVKIKRFNI